jgi:DNA-binding NarL/FixJ family response regulator
LNTVEKDLKNDRETHPQKMIRVLLADDHPVVRNGIHRLLDREEDIRVIGEACDGEETLAMVKQHLPDVLLLDMEMPLLNGIEVTKRIRKEFPGVGLLVLSGYDDRSYILELLQLGVNGYLIKDEAMDSIVDAVRGVARGETGWLSRRVSALVTTWMRKEEDQPTSLTQRELEVLRFVVAGKTNKGIALELHISEKTIEKYLESIMRKLEVSSRVEAAVYAVRNGLLNKLAG